MSLRFFSMGEINYTDENGKDLGNYNPMNWQLMLPTRGNFRGKISGAVAGRFIYSNLSPDIMHTDASVRPGYSVPLTLLSIIIILWEIKGTSGGTIAFDLTSRI